MPLQHFILIAESAVPDMSYVQIDGFVTSCWRTAEAQSNSDGWLVARDDARGAGTTGAVCRLCSAAVHAVHWFRTFRRNQWFLHFFPFETFDVEALKGGEQSWHCFAALHHVVITWRFPILVGYPGTIIPILIGFPVPIINHPAIKGYPHGKPPCMVWYSTVVICSLGLFSQWKLRQCQACGWGQVRRCQN